jgi:secreted protein with Ig-like and vWFA domain
MRFSMSTTNSNDNGVSKFVRFLPILTWVIAGAITIAVAWGVQTRSVAAMDLRIEELSDGGSKLAVSTAERVAVLEKTFEMHMTQDARRMDEINKKLDTLIGLHTKP